MKTPVNIIRRGRKAKAGFINGELRDRRRNGITKVLVYHFADNGDLLVDMIPIKFVQSVVFELEG